MAKTIQDGATTNGAYIGTKYSAQDGMIKNNARYDNFGYFIHGIDVTHQNIDKFNPYLKGRSRLFMHKVPVFMEKVFPDITKRFKQYIETAYKSIGGISDIDVQFATFEGGFNNQKFEVANQSQDTTESLTVSLYEQTGSPVREFLETWITGVRDPRSGIAHYHGAIRDGSVSYGQGNHTAEFIYYVLDPTATRIEYACMFANCFPRKVAKDHYNYESGDNGEVSLDIEFAAQHYESVYINDIAKWYKDTDNLTFSYLTFNPNVSTSDAIHREAAENKGGSPANYTLNLQSYASSANIGGVQ